MRVFSDNDLLWEQAVAYHEKERIELINTNGGVAPLASNDEYGEPRPCLIEAPIDRYARPRTLFGKS